MEHLKDKIIDGAKLRTEIKELSEKMSILKGNKTKLDADILASRKDDDMKSCKFTTDDGNTISATVVEKKSYNPEDYSSDAKNEIANLNTFIGERQKEIDAKQKQVDTIVEAEKVKMDADKKFSVDRSLRITVTEPSAFVGTATAS